MLGDRLSKIKETSSKALHSQRGRNVLLYLMFVCISFVFWVFLSLDSEVQKDYEVPVELTEIPDSVTIISKIPSSFSVSVQGKGSQLLRFLWGPTPMMKIKFDNNISERGIFSLSKLKIDSKLRDYFGQGIQIISVKPDSIRLPFTTMPGEKVKLKIDADIRPDLQCIVSGPITANIDSVKVYGIDGVPHSLSYVQTDLIRRSGLKDTTRIEVGIRPINGLRIIPDRVIVTIPVEPLIAKRRNIPVDVMGLPDDLGLITFPSSIEVSYLVPMSRYNEDYPLKAFVDFPEIDQEKSHVGVTLSLTPDYYRNIILTPDSLEYIIERKHLP